MLIYIVISIVKVQTVMNETLKVSISKKIFTLQDIKELSNILFQQLSVLKTNPKYHWSYSNFSMDLNGDTSYNSTSPDIFDNPYAIRTKQVLRIYMTISLRDNNGDEQQIKISLSQGSYGNYFEISGSDSMWVSGINGQIMKVLDGIMPM